MNKSELVASVADKTALPKAQVAQTFDAVFEAIKAGLTAGEKITLPGLLTFEVKDQAARTARNPATGAEMQVAAKRVVKVRLGKTLKDAVA